MTVKPIKPYCNIKGFQTALCVRHRGRPLTEEDKTRNKQLSKTRHVMEQSFGTLHHKFRYHRAAYFGLLNVTAQSHLKAIGITLPKSANRLRVSAV